MTELDFTVFQPSILEYLARGRSDSTGSKIEPEVWFRTCVALEYERIASMYGCRCKISKMQTEEARLYWVRDVGRVEVQKPEPVNGVEPAPPIPGDGKPDHFKQAGFLAFWLRRRLAVAKATGKIAYDTAYGRSQQQRFLMDRSEIAAFLFGFNICLFYESKTKLDSSLDITDDLSRLHLDRDYIFDVATLMKNKTVSPHALYLIYRSIFQVFPRK